jgi:hypothetical protein
MLKQFTVKQIFLLVILVSFLYNIYFFPKYRTFNLFIMFIILFNIILSYTDIFAPQFTINEQIFINKKVNKILDSILINYKNIGLNLNIDDVYPINNIPINFIFIPNNPFIINIIFKLKFLESFNKDEYYKLIILLEYFLKYYYKTILDEYDYDTVIPMLVAIRNNILNILIEQTYSIPINLNLPDTKYDISNTDTYIHNILVKLQSYTMNKLKILEKKNNKSNFILELPKAKNVFINDHKLY